MELWFPSWGSGSGSGQGLRWLTLPGPRVWNLRHTPACWASGTRSKDPPRTLLPLTALGQDQAEGPAQAGIGAGWASWAGQMMAAQEEDMVRPRPAAGGSQPKTESKSNFQNVGNILLQIFSEQESKIFKPLMREPAE